MIEIRKSDERGHANHGWLDTFHTFSFGEYMNPDFMGFGHLRVLNQDRVAAAAGFPKHGHRDMEIISFVLEGTLEHEDSMGNITRMPAGEVQVMSAGKGVLHSEYNGSSEEPLHFLQMWIPPRTKGTPPRYAQRNVSLDERRGRLASVVTPLEDQGDLPIDQDARMSVGFIGRDDALRHELSATGSAWLHLARGSIELNGKTLEPGDGAGIVDVDVLEISGIEDADVVLWEFANA